MSFSEYISPLFGRCVMAWFFFNQVFHYGGSWNATISEMQGKGIPLAPLLLALALILIILGAISLVLGFHTRHGAMVLFTVTLIATLLLHDFWHFTDTGLRVDDYQTFARNIAICGGLLFIVGMGSGPFAFDTKREGGKGKKH